MLSAVLIAATAVFVGAALQSATGFGFALVAAPVLFAVVSPEEAVTTVIVLSTITGVMLLALDRNSSAVLRGPVARMLAGAVPGAIAGVFILEALRKDVLQVAVGIGVIGAALLQARARAEVRAQREPEGAPAFGLLAGTLTTTTSLNGPPLVLWLQHAGVGRRELRATLAACFIGLNLLGAAAMLALGALEAPGNEARLAVLITATIAGQIAGREIFIRLDERRFRAVGIVLATVSGAVTLGIGAASVL